jgi:hypothetical protein
LGIFVIAFTAGPHAPLLVMEIAWAIIFIVGFLAFLIVRKKVASGASDLVIDDLNRSITLPRTFGRTEPCAIAADQLQSLVVEDVVRHGSERSRTDNFVPTLIWRDRAGNERREKLFKLDKSDSDCFAEWLRERLKLKS